MQALLLGLRRPLHICCSAQTSAAATPKARLTGSRPCQAHLHANSLHWLVLLPAADYLRKCRLPLGAAASSDEEDGAQGEEEGEEGSRGAAAEAEDEDSDDPEVCICLLLQIPHAPAVDCFLATCAGVTVIHKVMLQ